MKQELWRSIPAAAIVSVAATAGAAQQSGWITVVDGLAVTQESSNLSGGGSFSSSRAFLRGGALYRNDDFSYGFLLSLGGYGYDFATPGAAPWDDVRDVRISAPIRFRAGNAKVFISPQLRWDYEDDASASDGFTYGVFTGVTWEVSPTLEIGPAFGAFSELESNDIDFFPALLVNWKMTDLWSLGTSTAAGATQGPGVTLKYQVSRSTSLSLSTRYERTRFRLDNNGLAPGGIGQDSSMPVVLSLDYKPNPGVSFNAFVGMEFDGELKLEDATGVTVSRQSYDNAMIAGLTFRVLF